ncbi:MAG: GntR family transcriptional regulator [Variovorax sp.]|nr:MAG: GntR family transcriptional regulator [Variovorax sp.]
MPLPKYHQIYLVLSEQLAEGRFEGGLPGEFALMAEFGVARVTVRRALARMADEGLISREPGRGTRPVPALPQARARNGVEPVQRANLVGLLENLVSMGLRTTVKVVSVEAVAASAAVATALQMEPGEAVQKAVRVRSTRGGPLSHITTYVPAEVARKFGRRELAKKPILVLLEESGVKVGLYDDAERPVQWLHGFYRPDRYTYEMQLSRVGGIDAKVWVSNDLSASFN